MSDMSIVEESKTSFVKYEGTTYRRIEHLNPKIGSIIWYRLLGTGTAGIQVDDDLALALERAYQRAREPETIADQ